MLNGIDPIFVTIPDTGNILRCGQTKVYDLIGEGKLVRVKLGRKTLVTMASIKKLADDLTPKLAA